MANVLFSGCSFFNGDGLELEREDPNNAVNVFAKTCFGSGANVVNVSEGGNSNREIFFETSKELFNDKYDYAFVGITSYPRYVFYTGLEPYDYKRRIVFSPDKTFVDHNGHAGSFTASWFSSLRDKFLAIHNDHFEIVDIVKNINLLIRQAENLGTKIYFVNNLAHWDNQYFKRLDSPSPAEITSYTQKLLDIHQRDDSDIATLYNLVHDEYVAHGTIKPDYWLNLYNSFASHKIDLGNDNYHPGPKTHQKFGLFLAQQFKTLNG